MPVWIAVCSVEEIEDEDIIGVDHGGKSYAVCLGPDGAYYSTDGLCGQCRAHLAGGLVDGFTVECPKDSARYDLRSGAAAKGTTGAGLTVYPARAEGGVVYIEV